MVGSSSIEQAAIPTAQPATLLGNGTSLDGCCYTRQTSPVLDRLIRRMENQVGLFNSHNRRHIAVAIRSDGRRVQVPQDNLGLVDVSLYGLLRSFELGIERVFVLITGSRQGDGRRDQR
jgi:hypothetical protein